MQVRLTLSLETTQNYMHLIDLGEDKYISEGTTDDNKAKELINAGFKYVATTPNGTMLFRKRK